MNVSMVRITTLHVLGCSVKGVTDGAGGAGDGGTEVVLVAAILGAEAWCRRG